MNFGSGGTTNWGGAAWANGFDAFPTGGTISVDAAGWTRYDQYYASTPAGSAADILKEGMYAGAGTLSLSGFTVGQEYLVQFVLADTRSDAGIPGRTITIDGTSANISSQDSTAYQYAYTDGKFAVVTARFTPSAGDTAFSFVPWVTNAGGSFGDGGVQMNAMNIMTIPEPSAALLGGLGMLALLRRRRA